MKPMILNTKKQATKGQRDISVFPNIIFIVFDAIFVKKLDKFPAHYDLRCSYPRGFIRRVLPLEDFI